MMGVTRLLILALVVMYPWTLCTQPIDSVSLLNENEHIHTSSDKSTIAVPGGFHHTTWANYSDVAVLINNRSEDSVIIGEAFAAARGIPEERIFRLTNESTPTGETINAGQFDEFFADPIREMMLNRSLGGEISYIVTTKGIPLRVNGGTNVRASFDSELALIDSAQYSPAIHANYWTEHAYGPWSDTEGEDYSSYSETPVPIFNRIDQGFYIVTRLTGYDVETALGLIDLANESFGSRGTTVLDLATNRNSSGYQFWNDALYRADEIVNGTLGHSTNFNQNSTYLTNIDDVIQYAAWGSNDGTWEDNQLPDSGLDAPDGSTNSGIRSWHSSTPMVSNGETSDWYWDDSVKKNGNGAASLSISSAPCTATNGEITSGLLAEYFDNQGLSYNTSFMPNLTDRVPNHFRSEANIDQIQVNTHWPGLDSRFADYFSVRHTGVLTIPETGDWTIYSNADDGVMIWIDDALVVNNSGVHSMREVGTTVNLTQGEHRFRAEFFEHGGWAGHIVSWAGPNLTKQVIPASAFSRAMSNPVRSDILAHHWDFEAGSGTFVEDLVGDANLSMTGSPTWQSCLLGNCIQLDGVDDELRVDVDDRLGNFTVSLWAKANHTGQPGYASVVAVNDVGGDFDSFQIMTSGSTPGVWQLYHNSRYDFGPVSASDWVHFVVAKDGDQLMQYMDGALVNNITLPSGAIDEIDLYKFGVNRAGNTHWAGLIDEVQVWTEALNASDITLVNGEVALDCPSFTTIGQGSSWISTNLILDLDQTGHAWILSGHGKSSGEINADWILNVEAYDGNGSLLSINSTSPTTMTPSWDQQKIRFRPHENATTLQISYKAEILNISRQGALHFDTTDLRIIRPHMHWVPGSIAETAVSTGGRSFNWGTEYGQSLIADLLEDGVSGAKGYVYEPYLTAVSKPDLLTAYYASGYNLGEAYTVSNGYLSWMGVIVGDPKMAPFANQLHDVEIRNASVPVRASANEIFDMHVDVANLGAAPASGWIEVRERIGNHLLTNQSITLPAGNESGSIATLLIPVTTSTTGYVDFQIRYIANDGPILNSSQFVQSRILSERIVHNNVQTVNTEINGPPVITDIACSSNVVPRGATVACWVDATDDFGMATAQMSVIDPDGNVLILMNALSSGSERWIAFFDVPGDAALDFYDVQFDITDIDGINATSNLIDALEFIDSPSVWYGIHIQGADENDWNGDTNLPSSTPEGMIRGQESVIRACVEDVDHDPLEEPPSFSFEYGIIGEVVALPKDPTSNYHCYASTLLLPLEQPLIPFLGRLIDSEGTIRSTRSILVQNDEPALSLTFERDGISEEFAFGVGNESVRISVIDLDALPGVANGQLTIKWPEQGEMKVPFTAMTDGTEVVVSIPAPGPGLTSGELYLEVSVIDRDAGQAFNSISLPVETRPPSISEISICKGGELSPLTNGSILNRGETNHMVVHLDVHRKVLQTTASIRQAGWSETLDISLSSPSSCNGLDAIVYTVNVPDDFTEGEASLVLIAVDQDSLASGWSESIEIVFPPPVIHDIHWPLDAEVGIPSNIEFNVTDLDDLSSVLCNIDIVQGNISILSVESSPDQRGGVLVEWKPGRQMDNVSASIVCRDGLGRVDESNITGLNVTGEVEQSKEEPSEENEGQAEGIGIMLPGIALAVLVLLSLFTLTLRSIRSHSLKSESESPWIFAESDALLMELDTPSISEDESEISTDETNAVDEA